MAGTRAHDEGRDDSLIDDDNLIDDDLESEIELIGDLVVAATSTDRRLRQDEVDELLGVGPKEDSAAGEPEG